MQGVHRDEYAWEAGAATYLEDAVWLPVERYSDTEIEANAVAGLV
jgi:hypothetical protein